MIYGAETDNDINHSLNGIVCLKMILREARADNMKIAANGPTAFGLLAQIENTLRLIQLQGKYDWKKR